MLSARRCALACCILAGAGPAIADDKPTASAQVLLEEVTGDIAEGMDREVRVMQSSLPPKGVTAWHTHPFPVTILVTQGTIVIEMEGREPKTVRAGEAWLEPVNVRMRGTNPSDTETLSAYLFQVSDPETPFLRPVE